MVLASISRHFANLIPGRYIVPFQAMLPNGRHFVNFAYGDTGLFLGRLQYSCAAGFFLRWSAG